MLRYRVAGDRVKTALLTLHDERGGFFSLMLYPPQDLDVVARRPTEMVFVLDCSGSMRGRPLDQSRRAIEHALTRLDPSDTFQIVRFSNDASQLGPRPLPATPENVDRGRRYVKSLRGNGGTMMIEGIKAALDFPHDEQRLRFITFLTDGYIGNETQVLDEIHDRLGASRIFSFGIGSATNRYLMNRMAKLGRGAVAYVGLNDDGPEIMDRFFERVSHPVMTDIEIEWGGLQVHDVLPRQVPDLFVGRPVVLTGRFRSSEPSTIRIRGRAGNEIVEASFDVDPMDAAGAHKALASVWARMYIAELVDRASHDGDLELPDRIRSVALEYGLVSAYTSFFRFHK